MSDITGFFAYIFYVRTKVFYNNKKYNIRNKINKDKYIPAWNKTRANKDGKLFQFVENFLPKQRKKFVRMFSYYYIKNPNFYIRDIITDEFKLYKFNEYQLSHIKEVIKADFKYIMYMCDKNNKTLKQVFRSTGYPLIFKMYDKSKISIYSLIVFNEVFTITKYINKNNLDFLEKEKYIFYDEKIFNKFRLVVKDILFDEPWIEILKDL